jgi:hypothetical protein
MLGSSDEGRTKRAGWYMIRWMQVQDNFEAGLEVRKHDV